MKNNDIKVLNCENAASTYRSLEMITGVSSKDIKDFLIDIDLEKLDLEIIHDLNFINKFISEFDPSLNYDRTNWFHFTRIDDPFSSLQ